MEEKITNIENILEKIWNEVSGVKGMKIEMEKRFKSIDEKIERNTEGLISLMQTNLDIVLKKLDEKADKSDIEMLIELSKSKVNREEFTEFKFEVNKKIARLERQDDFLKNKRFASGTA